jgi:abortive infection bacteriophage resistance protein
MIGQSRFDDYAGGLAHQKNGSISALYLFDLELRSLMMKGFCLVEHRLIASFQTQKTLARRVTFGDLRRIYKDLPTNVRFEIASSFGMPNQRELDSLLANFNAFRNRAAHHERVWNFKVLAAVPKSIHKYEFHNIGQVLLPHSVAATIAGLDKVLNKFTFDFAIADEVQKLIDATAFDSTFILQNLGFEVP